jgi:hypothetical protein
MARVAVRPSPVSVSVEYVLCGVQGILRRPTSVLRADCSPTWKRRGGIRGGEAGGSARQINSSEGIFEYPNSTLKCKERTNDN